MQFRSISLSAQAKVKPAHGVWKERVASVVG